MNNEIIIQKGFPNDLLPSAVDLYDVAFGAKLSIAIPNPVSRRAVLKDGFVPEFSFTALCNNQMLGIAGFKTKKGSLTGGISLGLLKEKLGYWGAIRAAIVLTLFERNSPDDQLLMDGICVSSEMRGHGIGTRLLNDLVDYARRERYRSLRLDVIDTNPSARRLYERIGFVPVKTEQFPYLKWLFGFSSVTQMEYSLERKGITAG